MGSPPGQADVQPWRHVPGVATSTTHLTHLGTGEEEHPDKESHLPEEQHPELPCGDCEAAAAGPHCCPRCVQLEVTAIAGPVWRRRLAAPTGAAAGRVQQAGGIGGGVRRQRRRRQAAALRAAAQSHVAPRAGGGAVVAAAVPAAAAAAACAGACHPAARVPALVAAQHRRLRTIGSSNGQQQVASAPAPARRHAACIAAPSPHYPPPQGSGSSSPCQQLACSPPSAGCSGCWLEGRWQPRCEGMQQAHKTEQQVDGVHSRCKCGSFATPPSSATVSAQARPQLQEHQRALLTRGAAPL